MVLNIGYLILDVKLIFVATLVKYFGFVSNILGFCLISPPNANIQHTLSPKKSKNENKTMNLTFL